MREARKRPGSEGNCRWFYVLGTELWARELALRPLKNRVPEISGSPQTFEAAFVTETGFAVAVKREVHPVSQNKINPNILTMLELFFCLFF